MPFEEIDTAVAFQADTPNQQPIHCCLIAVPEETSESQNWNLLDLDAIVCDTIDLPKIRAVDLDALPDTAGLFPSIFLPSDPEQDSVQNWESIGNKVRQSGRLNLDINQL